LGVEGLGGGPGAFGGGERLDGTGLGLKLWWGWHGSFGTLFSREGPVTHWKHWLAAAAVALVAIAIVTRVPGGAKLLGVQRAQGA